MSSTPFMQFYVGDYLADTLDLTTEQHGAYLLILMTMWQHDAKLPNDPVKLARIARMTPAKFRPVWDEISRFFVVEGDKITNPRLTKERKKAAEKSSKRATAGRAGGQAKALKDNEARLANAMPMPQHSPDTRDQRLPEANASGREASEDEPAEDFSKQVFDRAVVFLGRHKVPEKQARALVGKWRKSHDDRAIFDAFAACSKAGAVDPVPWITARLGAAERVSASVIPLDRVAALALANIEAEAERKAASR